MNDNYRAFLSDLADVLEKHNGSIEVGLTMNCEPVIELDQNFSPDKFLFTTRQFQGPLEANDIRRTLEG